MILIFWKYDLYGFGVDKIASIFFGITATISLYSVRVAAREAVIKTKGYGFYFVFAVAIYTWLMKILLRKFILFLNDIKMVSNDLK